MMLQGLSAWVTTGVELISTVGYSPPFAESARRSSPIFWIFLFGVVALLFVLFWYFTRSKHADDHGADHAADGANAAAAVEPAQDTQDADVVVERSADIVEAEEVIDAPQAASEEVQAAVEPEVVPGSRCCSNAAPAR